MKENHITERVIEILSKHPEGLTATDLAKLLGIHRHTVTKYLYQLIGSEDIYQRQVGPAKLYYISKKGGKK